MGEGESMRVRKCVHAREREKEEVGSVKICTQTRSKIGADISDDGVVDQRNTERFTAVSVRAY
ncbi:hypothetical protein MAR_004753 [Mya arenaria]|uniref:Uncharacterized protein n=1 Tax=Mya arenaria TaxID=6604 RepID=A0ABY7F1N0_MYAAR|nr:hypothetical protein MAR_004753 [Mya arenaria]